MKTLQEYLTWLNDLNEKSAEDKTKKSIEKLIILIKELDLNKTFDKDASQIYQRLERLVADAERDTNRTKRFVDSCFSDTIIITAKFFNLVKKEPLSKRMDAARN